MTTTSETIGKLDNLRRLHGAKSDIGGVCSNLIEQIKNLDTATNPTQREALTKFIADQQTYLAKLLSDLPRQAGEG